jgi:hypothetical protein
MVNREAICSKNKVGREFYLAGFRGISVRNLGERVGEIAREHGWKSMKKLAGNEGVLFGSRSTVMFSDILWLRSGGGKGGVPGQQLASEVGGEARYSCTSGCLGLSKDVVL